VASLGLSSISKIRAGTVAPNICLGRARIFAEAKIFLAGENRVVRRKTRLDRTRVRMKIMTFKEKIQTVDI